MAMRSWGKRKTADANGAAWTTGTDTAEWSAWVAAAEELTGDPCVENFERVVAAANELLVALTPPPGSHRPGPHRLSPLVALWNAQAEALREQQGR